MKDLMKIYAFVCLGLLLLGSCQKDGELPVPEPEKSRAEILIERLQNPKSDEVMIVAHRGEHQFFPENSLASIQSCIEKNIDIVEIDLRISADGEFVLIHDKTLERTTNGTGDVADKTLVQLKQLRLLDKDGNVTEAQIPTLREALELMKGKVLFMLDKSELYISSLLPILEETGTKQQAVFLFFDEYNVIKNRFKEHLHSIHYIPAVHRNNDDIPNYISTFQNQIAPAAFAFWIKEQDSEVHQSIAQAKGSQRIWLNTVEANQCAGRTDAVSLINPAQGWGWCLEQGADILLTDYPIDLLQYLRSINRHE